MISHRTGHDLRRLFVIVCLIFAVSPAIRAEETAIVLPNQIHLAADDFEFGMDLRSFSAEGKVRIVRDTDVITADRVTGDLMTGDISATGNVHFISADRTLTGESFIYNYQTRNGVAHSASGTAGPLFFSGSEIKAEDGIYHIAKATFTTCNLAKPHYHLAAKEIIIEPGKQVTAYKVSIYIMGTKIISAPKYKIGLAKGSGSKSLLPSIGYSGRFGYFTSYSFDLDKGPKTDSSLELRLSSKFGVQGGLMYDRINGHPYFARLTYREPAYGGASPDTVISRLPEIGARIYSNPVMRSRSVDRDPLRITQQYLGPDGPIAGARRFTTISEFTAGEYVEKSRERVGAGRVDARILASYDPLTRGSNITFSPAAFLRYSAYSGGNTYGVAAVKLAAGKRLAKSTYASLAYTANATIGRTPFAFDQVEIRDEISGALFLKISDVKVFVGERYDIAKGKIFDTTIVLSKTFHCIESSLTWRGRFRDVSLDVKLAHF